MNPSTPERTPEPPRAPAVELEVYLDFDGTLVDPNVAIVLIGAFAADGDRLSQVVDEELHAGKITLREAWEREAAALRADQIPQMIEFVRREIPLRAGAHELVRLLQRYEVPTQIISGGLDFYITPVLEREGFDLPFLSDTARPGLDGALEVQHPYGHPTCRLCGICKAQAVRARHPDRRSVFVGDGSTDKYAAEVSDIVFARRRLVDICRQREIPFYPFEEFGPVTAQLERWLSGEEELPPRRRLGYSNSKCPISSHLSLTPIPGRIDVPVGSVAD